MINESENADRPAMAPRSGTPVDRLRLVLNQICRAMLERLNTDNRERHRLLLELDEFDEIDVTNCPTIKHRTDTEIKIHLAVQSFNDPGKEPGDPLKENA